MTFRKIIEKKRVKKEIFKPDFRPKKRFYPSFQQKFQLSKKLILSSPVAALPIATSGCQKARIAPSSHTMILFAL